MILREEAIKNEIIKCLTEYFEGTEFFIVDIKVSATAKIGIFVDGISNITIDKCAEISRFLEKHLEENQLVGEKYVLEVSSPGMDQPLKVMAQYKKAIGRDVEVVMCNGMKYEGQLINVDDKGILLNRIEKIKNKVVNQEELTINFEDIKSTTKQIKF